MSNVKPQTLGTVMNNIYFKSRKTPNELLLRAGQKQYNEINVIVSNADKNKKLPHSNPFLVQAFITQVVNRHDNIDNMKFTRQGKILFTTKDLLCAVQLLSLTKFMETDISTDVIWENICPRFFIFDIPVNTPLEELAKEIQEKNDMDVIEMRRFLKQNSVKDMSPVLITVLGTTIPDEIKIWFINQKIQHFIDRPRQCTKCYSLAHASRICDRTNVCFLCCEEHVGPCQGPEKCINCKGPHNAKSTSCPAYIKEGKILEFKCRNHITTSEARRVYHLQNMKYSEVVKSPPASAELQNTVTLKFEALLQSVNEKFESLIQSVNEKFEKQTAIFAEMLHKTIESIMQNMYKIIVQSLETTTSPTRKKKLPKNLDLSTSLPMQWDAGGFSHNFNQEVLAVEVHFKDFHFIIINLYAPQGLNIENVKYFFDSFSIPVFIFGDFNLHHPFWGSNRSSPLSNDFVEWLQNSSFILLNSSNPTYAAYTGSASLLDLSICSASISHAVDCYVSESNFESDHYPVIITWSILDHTPKKIKSIDRNRIMSNSATVLTTNTRLNALTSKIS
ncbi:hypothetical protein AVEN_258042-1 [Araneus ventricosus]|uniref:Endonuclease/exonuclease/phosphatase domain-containing protein n=1 Tax=Araneus ventricosus TaxID=182803 RepID=A0A4Y2AGZ9_ARAVE|nr:hypothetical protein AVEN_258042-1 [Araneus ventricosus]